MEEEEKQAIQEAENVEASPAPEETASEEGAVEQPKTRAIYERVKSIYPDREFASDDDYDSALGEHLDSLEGKVGRYEKANERIRVIIGSEPILGNIIKDMDRGATFREALSMYIDPEDLTPIEGDPDYEGWEKNNAARQKSYEEKQARSKALEENRAMSEQNIREFAEENNMSEEQAADFLSRVDETLGAIYEGNVSKDFLASMMKAINYEVDVQSAQEAGEVKGRNEQIETKRQEGEKKKNLPPTVESGGGGEMKDEGPRKKHRFDRLLEEERRTKIL